MLEHTGNRRNTLSIHFFLQDIPEKHIFPILPFLFMWLVTHKQHHSVRIRCYLCLKFCLLTLDVSQLKAFFFLLKRFKQCLPQTEMLQIPRHPDRAGFLFLLCLPVFWLFKKNRGWEKGEILAVVSAGWHWEKHTHASTIASSTRKPLKVINY